MRLFLLQGGRFLKQPWARKALASEAAGCLLVAKLATSVLPLKSYRPLFDVQVGSPKQLSPAELREVVWAVQSVSDWAPIYLDCLPQALGLQLMLWRRDSPGQVRFGVKKGADGILAHAWLVLGEKVLIGRLPDFSSYSPLV